MGSLSSSNLNIIFSRNQSADEWIKKFLELSDNAKNVVVVSDDKEIIFFAKACRAHVISVEEFIRDKVGYRGVNQDSEDDKIGFRAMHKINEELRRLWLK